MNSGYDKQYLYLDEPDPDEKFQDHNDCQYIPILFDDFERMPVFAARIIITSIQINK
ncbi:peptidase C39 family protein [Colwellia sp. MB02u-10]|nr:peptidase C39 family protein [Colwellia sp. MB02u-10]